MDWYSFFRDICTEYFLAHPAVIGGPGVEVEIEQNKFGKKRKCSAISNGRVADGHWVFGGIERGSGECFLVEVENRDAATLLPIITQHVRPGSAVLTDDWSAYNQLTATSGNTVNHSLHFVDPATVTVTHTQGAEGMWSCCKRMMRDEKVAHSALFETYLPEFMWRKKYGGPMHCIWQHLKAHRRTIPCIVMLPAVLFFLIIIILKPSMYREVNDVMYFLNYGYE